MIFLEYIDGLVFLLLLGDFWLFMIILNIVRVMFLQLILTPTLPIKWTTLIFQHTLLLRLIQMHQHQLVSFLYIMYLTLDQLLRTQLEPPLMFLWLMRSQDTP